MELRGNSVEKISLESLKDIVQQQLIEGDVELALQYLKKHSSAKYPSLQNDVIVFSGNYTRLNREHAQGVITHETFQVGLSRLSQNILGFLRDIIRKFPENEIAFPSETNLIKILFLGANPVDKDRLNLGKEVNKITTNLKLAKERDRLVFSQKWAVKVENMIQEILDEDPDILHFSGHGEPEGIYLEQENGRSQLVSTAALESLFKLFNTVQCVLLNSCYSEAQAKAIKAYIPYVIGMPLSILDKAAIAFSAGFYQAIGAGKAIPEAYELGKIAILMEGYTEDNLPILLVD